MRLFTLTRVFLRTFFIQSGWNFERMQNLGFAFSILPAIKEIDPTGIRKRIIYHLKYFNTHPYMASPILGAVIRMEEDGRERREIDMLKRDLMGSYGAIGDSFFWNVLKPFASVISIIFALMGNFMAPVILLCIYNIPHIWMRWNGLYKGYDQGERIGDYINRIGLPSWSVRIRYITLVLLALLLYLLAIKFVTLEGFQWKYFVSFPETILVFSGVLLLVSIAFFLLKKGLTPINIVYIYTLILGATVFVFV